MFIVKHIILNQKSYNDKINKNTNIYYYNFTKIINTKIKFNKINKTKNKDFIEK